MVIWPRGVTLRGNGEGDENRRHFVHRISLDNDCFYLVWHGGVLALTAKALRGCYEGTAKALRGYCILMR